MALMESQKARFEASFLSVLQTSDNPENAAAHLRWSLGLPLILLSMVSAISRKRHIAVKATANTIRLE
jgi:hypothetical protein